MYRPTDDYALKIAMGGGPPNFKFANGEIGGSDMQLSDYLAKSLDFYMT